MWVKEKYGMTVECTSVFESSDFYATNGHAGSDILTSEAIPLINEAEVRPAQLNVVVLTRP